MTLRRAAFIELLEPRRLLAALGGDDLTGVPGDMLTSAYLFIGDHSVSNSEKWEMTFGNRTYGGAGQAFGEVTRVRGDLRLGESYPIRVRHVDTNRYVDGEKAPDYDLRSWIDDYARPAWTDGQSTPVGTSWFVTDPQNILHKRLFQDDTNIVSPSAVAHLHVPLFDLDVDSDNSGVIDRSLLEDRLEAMPGGGKIIPVASGDADGDGIPDIRDFDGIEGFSFAPMELSLSQNLTFANPSRIDVTLNYDMSRLRIWTKDAGEARLPSDVIGSGTTMTAASLRLTPGGITRVFVEAIRGNGQTALINAAVNVAGAVWSGLLTDTVRVVPVEADLQAATVGTDASGNVFTGMLPKADEDTIGAFLPVNSDDDNYSAMGTGLGADMNENQNGVEGEDDLLRVTLKAMPGAGAGDLYNLRWTPGLRVWQQADKRGPVVLSREFPADQDTVLYVEAHGKLTTQLRLNLKQGQADWNPVDTIKVTTFDWEGALNVPEFGAYRYTAEFGGDATPDGAAWVDPTNGQLVGAGTGPLTRDIRWSAGPEVGIANLKVNDSYTWGLGVNVVGVTVNTPQNAFNNLGSTTLNVNQKAGDPEIAVISGPHVPARGDGSDIEHYNNAIEWSAKVIFEGPGAANDRGLRHITAGFTQALTVNALSLEYSNGKFKRPSTVEVNSTYLDRKDGSEAPFYDNENRALFNNATDQIRSKTIASEDRPFVGGIPKYYGGQGADANATLTKINIHWDFDLRVSTISTDPRIIRRPEEPVEVVSHAEAKWSWNATGNTVFAQGGLVTYTPVNPRQTLVPNRWDDMQGGTPLTSGDRFNDLIENFDWLNT